MYLMNRLDSPKVINTRINTNLVHDSDTSSLGLSIKLHHSRRDIAGCDNILLVSDSGLDNGGMEGIWDQTDHEIDLCDFGVKVFLLVDIKRDGLSVFDTSAKLLSTREGSASYHKVKMVVRDRWIWYLPTVTSQPLFARTSTVGLVTKPAPSNKALYEMVVPPNLAWIVSIMVAIL